MQSKQLRAAILAVRPYASTTVTLSRKDGTLLVAAGTATRGACVEIADPVSLSDGEPFDLAISQPAWLTSLLAAAPEEITMDDGRAVLTFAADDWLVTIPTLAGELPTPAYVDAWAPFPKALLRAAFCIAPDDNRYGLNGLHIEHTGTALRAVSTDGNRLCWAEAAGDPLPMPPKSLIPRELLSVIRDGSEIGFTGTAAPVVTIRNGDDLTWARLITADFPDYRQVLPKSSKWAMTVDRDALLGALRRIAPLTWKRSYGEAAYEVCDGRLRIRGEAMDYGRAVVSLPVETTGEMTRKIGLRTGFLAEALRAMPKGPIQLAGGNDLAAVTVTSPDDPTILCVVMPVRLD